MSRVLITGATGLVGRELATHYNHLLITSRQPERASKIYPQASVLQWPLDDAATVPPEGIDIIFHLAGEPVGDGRWSQRRMQRIRDSRVDGTRSLVQWCSGLNRKPSVLICASAVGIYGHRGDEELTENSSVGDGFLADVCQAWEAEAMAAEAFGTRVVCARFGLILSPKGGALKKMLPAFKMGLGGPLGSGQQWMPWIHMDDVVGLLRHAAAHPIHGPLNCVSPNPVRNIDFAQALAKAVGRRTFLRMPKSVLNLALGKMSELLLMSQRVKPVRAVENHWDFQFSQLDDALVACLRPDMGT